MSQPRYDVILHGFPDGATSGRTPVESLAAAFGIPLKQAERFVLGLPKVVKHDAPSTLASRYEQVLRGIGADVELRPSNRVS
jgi:hypothetical protein